MNADEIFDTLKTLEDLHEDLEPYLHEVPGIGEVLRHPLVYSVPHARQINAYCNRMYEQKLKMIAEAKDAGDVWRIIHLHEPPYRLHALLKFRQMIESDRAYWELVRDVWIPTDNPHQSQAAWEITWRSARPDRHFVMDEEERADLASRPETFRVWRGGHHRKTLLDGFSWTLDRDEAVWFARRFENSSERRIPYLAEATVRRDEVLALLHTGEREVVVDPLKLIDPKLTRIREFGPLRRKRLGADQ